MPSIREADERSGRPRLRSWAGIAVGAALVVAVVAGVVAWQRSQGPDVDEFCARMAGAAALDDRLATDPANLANELDALRGAADVAPPEVADDVAVLVTALARLESAAAGAPADPQGALQEELRAMQPEVAQLEAAAQAVGAYTRDTCGLALAGTRTTGTSRPLATGADTTPTTDP